MQNSKLSPQTRDPASTGQLKIKNFKDSTSTLHFALCTLHSWRSQAGQTLVTLLVFTIVAITITSAAVVIILTNSIGTSKFEQGTNAYYVAESGAENGLLRLLRDPTYCGETLPVDSGTATIGVIDGGGGCNGTSPITITSTGNMGNFSRKVRVIATFVNNILTVTSWKEVF